MSQFNYNFFCAISFGATIVAQILHTPPLATFIYLFICLFNEDNVH